MSDATDRLVLCEVREGVLHVTINREEKRNALSRATLTALREAFADAAHDASLHAVVLSGAGERSFAAGGDLREFDVLRSQADARALFDHAGATLDAIRATPVPVIAALNGTALGGGAELAIACDYRLAARHAGIGFVQATLAITTGFGGAADLFALLGDSRAMRVLAEARVLAPLEARTLGLIDEVCDEAQPLHALVAHVVQPFAECPPHVVRAIKQLANARRRQALQAMRDAERDAFVATWTAPEHWARARKFLERRRAERALSGQSLGECMKASTAELDEAMSVPYPDRTPSGLHVPVVVGPTEVHDGIGAPGRFPFTRGIFPDGYRGRLWTMRQYSGFGTAEESNERYRFLLEQGQTGLSVALDLPTQCGLDPDDPMARSEIGKVGVSLSNLSEMELLFKGIDLSRISTSFTINGTAAMIYAMYVACADKQGVPREKLTGTIQNDILKEYVARGTWIFPVRPSMRLIADSILYSNEVSPRFNPISIAGAHMRDAGCTAVEEMAYTLANGLAYVDAVVARGGDVAKFARRLSFFFYVHMDLFEEVAKFRAGRRIWARLIKERYGVDDERAQMFRFGVVCGGSSLTSAQPYNNIVRVAIETCAAVMGGAQSVFTCAYDEAFQIPTEFSAELALRTQQIIGYESGIARTVDPLGGSYFVEELTDRSEARMRELMTEIDDYGGAVKAIEDGWLQLRIARSALQRKRDTDAHERLVVGQNCFRRENQAEQPGELFHLNPQASATVVERFERLRDTRNETEARKTLTALGKAAAREEGNLMPYLVDCCHAYATVGEMVAQLKEQWGEFEEPVHL